MMTLRMQFLIQEQCFLTAVRCLPIRFLDDIGDGDLKDQYREFTKRLENVTKNILFLI